MTEEMPAHQPSTLRFHYLKGDQFRSVHVDGVIGSLTPSGGIHCATFSERQAIPQEEELALNPDGSLGDLVAGSRRAREGIVREMDINLIMSLDVARSLRTWLSEKIALLEERTEPAPETKLP